MNQRIVSILIQVEIVIFMLGLQDFVIGSTVENTTDNNESNIGGPISTISLLIHSRI
jgi:hypothetical protein